MLRYILAATALRVFSINNLTKEAYRYLGNRAGNKSRARGIPAHYIRRADENLRYLESFGAIRDGAVVMELGTGWVHWEALYTRLFYDVSGIVYDVWDNRQFDGLKAYAAELRGRLAQEVERSPEAIARAEHLLDDIARCSSFDEVYELLGFRYVISPNGSLDPVETSSLDLIFSSDVMEHVPAEAVPVLARDMMRVLRPGGYSAHQIVEADHLCIYDRKVHSKNYLRYSDRTWRRWFENEVQYINRLQPSDFHNAFAGAGFEIAGEEIMDSSDTSALKIDSKFSGYSKEEIDAVVSRLIARKPATANA